MNLPKARNVNLVIQHLNNEVLTYDTITNQAYCLNETAAKVFNACDGEQTFEDLKRAHHLTDDLIFLALEQLHNGNLLADETNFVSPFAEMNRREVIKKVGLTSIVALPVIAALIAPTPLNAASNCLQDGESDCRVTPCCPGLECQGGTSDGQCFSFPV